MAFHLAESAGERLELRRCDVLLAKEQDFMFEQLRMDLREQRIGAGNIGERDIINVCTDRSGCFLQLQRGILMAETEESEYYPVAEQEGIIRFAYDLQAPETEIAEDALFEPLRAWRTIFRDLGLVGQDPARYHGLGFGNLSTRDPDRENEFIITASQSGGVENLQQQQMVRITHCNLERFWVDACGEQPPSSETLTHAMVYAADPRIAWIFHCHSPAIWSRASELTLPCTDAAVGYGSVDMVGAVASLLQKHHSRPLVFATLGHTDGIFACGPTARDTGGLLVSYLAKALT
jgi:ribulose-5-phosphate 4-epimerase/fuculose-1-phosphate aldolase